jgi:DNA-binding response OmpR family regulator
LDILIVEDDKMLNQVLLLQLTMIGLSVRSARTGYEALKMIGETVPKLLILDIGLPDLNGKEVVNILRQQPATSNISLLIHTSLDLSIEEQEALKLGPTRCVTKATAFSDQLEKVVNELLNESNNVVQL